MKNHIHCCYLSVCLLYVGIGQIVSPTMHVHQEGGIEIASTLSLYLIGKGTYLLTYSL